jgi:hypothetical protein
MRSQRHKRPRHRVISPWPEGMPAPEDVVARVRYVGSPEHKSYPSPAGPPVLRSDASRCDPRPGYDAERFTEILQEGIRRRCIGAIFEGGFPKYVWGWVNGQLFEARHLNGPQGSCKAYPLEDVEKPDDPQNLLDWENGDA